MGKKIMQWHLTPGEVEGPGRSRQGQSIRAPGRHCGTPRPRFAELPADIPSHRHAKPPGSRRAVFRWGSRKSPSPIPARLGPAMPDFTRGVYAGSGTAALSTRGARIGFRARTMREHLATILLPNAVARDKTRRYKVGRLSRESHVISGLGGMRRHRTKRQQPNCQFGIGGAGSCRQNRSGWIS
jgi:hypothetical protein